MIKTGNRNFWIAQALGWGLFAIVNFIIQYAAIKDAGKLEETDGKLWLNSMIAFTCGILVTSIYRYFIKSRSLNLLHFRRTLLYIVVSTIILTLAFLLLINLLLMIRHEGRVLTTIEFLGNAFIFSILLLIWNSLYFLIHYIHSWKNAESEKWQLAASVKEAQLGNLKSQINPHFMFNAINNIRSLISEDPDKAKEMLLNFSDMFRYSLVNNGQSLVSIRDEVEVVKKYFDLLSIQFEERLDYKIDVNESLLEHEVPPMMLQLLVENAIKHGISELPDGGLVEVNVNSENGQIYLVVTNSGSLNDSESLQQKLGVGLKNIKERLQLLYGSLGIFELLEENGSVKAVVSYPIDKVTT